jgi:hypothetical protein
VSSFPAFHRASLRFENSDPYVNLKYVKRSFSKLIETLSMKVEDEVALKICR